MARVDAVDQRSLPRPSPPALSITRGAGRGSFIWTTASILRRYSWRKTVSARSLSERLHPRKAYQRKGALAVKNIAIQLKMGVTGKPFIIFEASLLLRMLAQQCGLEPGEMIWMGADCYLYRNHKHLVVEQLSRTRRAFPQFGIVRRPGDIFGYRIDDFSVNGYDPHAAIAAPVAV